MEVPSRHFADRGYKKKGPMRCHTSPEKQRGSSALLSLREPTQTHQGRKTLGSNVLYQCNRDAERAHGAERNIAATKTFRV
jgi:hypothetical protein